MLQPKSDRKVDIGCSEVNKSEKTKHLGITRNEHYAVDIEERIKHWTSNDL